MTGSNYDNANLSKPSNAVLRCANPSTVRIMSRKEGTRDKFITRRCRECWQCVTSQQNDIVGRMLAQSAVTQSIEMWTLTYDGKTPESRIGAKQRIPAHVQKFQKAMRQRERRGLSAYNKREKQRAKDQGREPKLIPTGQSYIKFFPVFEFGSKNGRGHFHVMVFFESHHEVPLNVMSTHGPDVCPETARRVWDLPNVRGAETPTLPPDANNPNLVDYRVRQDGSQLHALWPHGFVNIECVTHDKRAVDYGGNPVERRKPSEQVVKSMFYMLKYLSKPNTKHKDCHLNDQELAEQASNLKKARGGNSMYRTGSRGLGYAFARAFGTKHASAGVPLNHVHFRVMGANVPRTNASMAKFTRKVERAVGVSKAPQYIIEAQRMVFQMQGGMACIAADTYIEISKAKKKADEALGEVGLMRLRQLEAKKANDWLRSAEGRFRRKTARQLTPVDQAWLEQKLKRANPLASSMLSGGFFDKQMPTCILPPEPYLGYILGEDTVPDFGVLKAKGVTANTELEKLEATVEAISIVGDVYRHVKTDAARYQSAKQAASGCFDVAQPHVAAYARPVNDEYTQAIYEQTVSEEWEKHLSGDKDASDLLFALEVARGHLYRPQQKPWSFSEYDAPKRLGLLWLNFSDQYWFPRQRERHIELYCAVRYVSKSRRLVITPDGRILMGRKGQTDKYVDSVSAGGKIYRRRSPVEKWGYRLVEPGQLSEAIAGTLPLRSFADSDPLFLDIEQPFKNTWAMSPTPEQARVLGLWNDAACKSEIGQGHDLVGIPF